MTLIEELALILWCQLREGDWTKTDLELIEEALEDAYQRGQRDAAGV